MTGTARERGEALFEAGGFAVLRVPGFIDEAAVGILRQDLEALPYERKDGPLYRVGTVMLDPGGAAARRLDRLLDAEPFRALLRRLAAPPRWKASAYEALRMERGDFLGYHCDSTHGRRLQGVLHLNPAWTRGEGGLLEIVEAASGRKVAGPLAPEAGQLVVFRSDPRFRHGVTPVTSNRPRFSVSFSFS